MLGFAAGRQYASVRIDLKRRGPIKDARTGKIDQPLPMRMRMRRMRRIECGEAILAGDLKIRIWREKVMTRLK
jgi:hypothetical protein